MGPGITAARRGIQKGEGQQVGSIAGLTTSCSSLIFCYNSYTYFIVNVLHIGVLFCSSSILGAFEEAAIEQLLLCRGSQPRTSQAGLVNPTRRYSASSIIYLQKRRELPRSLESGCKQAQDRFIELEPSKSATDV